MKVLMTCNESEIYLGLDLKKKKSRYFCIKIYSYKNERMGREKIMVGRDPYLYKENYFTILAALEIVKAHSI